LTALSLIYINQEIINYIWAYEPNFKNNTQQNEELRTYSVLKSEAGI